MHFVLLNTNSALLLIQIIALERFYQIIKYTVHLYQLCKTKIVLEMCRLINICANAE